MQIVSGQNPVEKGTGLWLFILYNHHGNKDRYKQPLHLVIVAVTFLKTMWNILIYESSWGQPDCTYYLLAPLWCIGVSDIIFE
jgi:hypothetical protein